MNCRQARALLAIHREHTKHPTDTPELEDHLAHCANCKDAYAQSQFIGERIRSLPPIESSAQAHEKLMQALAAEHVHFLQRTSTSAPVTPAPAFLAPYLSQLAEQESGTDSLAVFSTAHTGPLPIIRALRPHRRSLQTQQHFAIIGLAASFMVVIMIGGLMSLLFLANQGPQSVDLPSNQVNLTHPEVAQADTASAATQTLYPHIASANANNASIYYSAYNDDHSSWVLEKFNQTNNTKTAPVSSSLLMAPSSRPIIILGSNPNWLIWLQMEADKKSAGKPKNSPTPPTLQTTNNNFVGPWSVKALYIGPNANAQTSNNHSSLETAIETPLTLGTGTFNPSTAPSWTTTPIQGLSFYKDHALLAFIDTKGTSDLISYQFAQDKVVGHKQLATATNQHVLTSPTATGDGNSIYWSEEWLTNAKGLNSNIWTQQISSALPQSGRWIPHTQAEQYLYRSDGLSFRPQIAGETLFLLSKNPANTVESNNNPASQAQQTSTATVTATPAGTSTPNATATSVTESQNISKLLMNPTSTDPMVLTAQIDTLVSGQLLAFTTNGNEPATTTLNDNAIVSDLQSGGSFLIWQNSGKNLVMYDANKKVMVNGIDSIDRESTAFISINNNAIVWTKYVAATDDTATTSDTSVTFNTIKWPK